MMPVPSISSTPMRTAPPVSSGACGVELVTDYTEFLALEGHGTTPSARQT